MDSLRRLIKLINAQQEWQQERPQVADVRSGRRAITAGHAGIKWTVEEHCEQFCARAFGNLDKMDPFTLNQKWSELTQEEIDNLSSPVTITGTEFMVRTLVKRQYPGLFTVNST